MRATAAAFTTVPCCSYTTGHVAPHGVCADKLLLCVRQTPRYAEPGLVTLEFVGAAATGVASVAAISVIGDPLDFAHSPSGARAAVLMVGVPALQGLTVCAIGRASKQFSGACGAPVAGAYLGMAPFVGLAFLASTSGQDALGKGIRTAVSLGRGLLVGAPLGATWAWNLRRQQR
jgi:hypothetical protein